MKLERRRLQSGVTLISDYAGHGTPRYSHRTAAQRPASAALVDYTGSIRTTTDGAAPSGGPQTLSTTRWRMGDHFGC